MLHHRLVTSWVILTHRNARQADNYSDASNSHEDLESTASNQPIIRAKGKAEAEEVLEDELAGESFNGEIA